MGFLDSFLDKYQQHWKFIIRPPRQTYHERYLGRTQGDEIQGVQYSRSDFTLKTPQKLYIKCSLFEPSNIPKNPKPACVIYLHGNSGSRMESLTCLQHLIPRKIAMCSFDFTGAGLSDGEFVTLGVNELKDAKEVLEHLVKTNKFSCFFLWGRSMGAVTALQLAAEEHVLIGGLVIDSAYFSFKKVVLDVANEKLKIPNIFVEGALLLLQGKLKKLCGVDVFSLEILKLLERLSTIPAFFTYTKEDKLVYPYHTETIYEKYPGPKEIKTFAGDHNAIRPDELMGKLADFILDLQHRNQLENNDISSEGDQPIRLGAGHQMPCRIRNIHISPISQKVNKKDFEKDIYGPPGQSKITVAKSFEGSEEKKSSFALEQVSQNMQTRGISQTFANHMASEGGGGGGANSRPAKPELNQQQARISLKPNERDQFNGLKESKSRILLQAVHSPKPEEARTIKKSDSFYQSFSGTKELVLNAPLKQRDNSPSSQNNDGVITPRNFLKGNEANQGKQFFMKQHNPDVVPIESGRYQSSFYGVDNRSSFMFNKSPSINSENIKPSQSGFEGFTSPINNRIKGEAKFEDKNKGLELSRVTSPEPVSLGKALSPLRNMEQAFLTNGINKLQPKTPSDKFRGISLKSVRDEVMQSKEPRLTLSKPLMETDCNISSPRRREEVYKKNNMYDPSAPAISRIRSPDKLEFEKKTFNPLSLPMNIKSPITANRELNAGKSLYGQTHAWEGISRYNEITSENERKYNMVFDNANGDISPRIFNEVRGNMFSDPKRVRNYQGI